MLVELTSTLSATAECPLDKTGFNGLHSTGWCDSGVSTETPRGELAQMCSRCCAAACQAPGTQLRTGSDGGVLDPAAALYVFRRGCSLNGGANNCLQASAIVLDSAHVFHPRETIP